MLDKETKYYLQGLLRNLEQINKSLADLVLLSKYNSGLLDGDTWCNLTFKGGKENETTETGASGSAR